MTQTLSLRRGATMRVARPLALALALGGLGLVGSGLATPAKAWLGQTLLERAWAAAQDGGEGRDARPWPWADMAPVAKVRVPHLGVEQLILDHASGEAMAWAPGHVRGTAPLGAPGLSAAAAHRDTHFAMLADLAPGDLIELELLDGTVAQYRMIEGHVVDSRVWRFPVKFDGPDILALATCWPFGNLTRGPERYVLFAERV